MSDIKLFRTNGNTVIELSGKSVALEKSLQTLIEKQLDVFLGIRFLATEYETGKAYAGRIDTLGIDENGCPCIIEYKRATNENVINQGLFYLDWLLNHKAEFELLVLRKFGQSEAPSIEWGNPRLLCIAGDFNKYDEYAVKQINRNIELLRYVRFGEELLLLQLVNAVAATVPAEEPSSGLSRSPNPRTRTVTDNLAAANSKLSDLYEAIKATLVSLGDDVQVKVLQLYIAFRRIKNFACVVVHLGQELLVVYVKVDPDTITLESDFTRDMRGKGHWGTGDLEITIRSMDDLEKAKPLLLKSYEAS